MQQYMQGIDWPGTRSAEKELEVVVGKLNRSQQCAVVARAQPRILQSLFFIHHLEVENQNSGLYSFQPFEELLSIWGKKRKKTKQVFTEVVCYSRSTSKTFSTHKDSKRFDFCVKHIHICCTGNTESNICRLIYNTRTFSKSLSYLKKLNVSQLSGSVYSFAAFSFHI